MDVEEILKDAEQAADLRNGEIVDRLLKRWRKTKCKFCQYKRDYVYCKIQAKRMKRDLRISTYDMFGKWLQDPIKFPSQYRFSQYESRMLEFVKMAEEFRAAMYREGQCTCSPFLILSRER